jgi:CDP-paratose 2-epimerase
MNKVLITGSGGLIGSESTRFFCKKGFDVIGIDNDMRAKFFGDEASTRWNSELLVKSFKNYRHLNIDIRDVEKIKELFSKEKFDLIIHCAAQPSHDWAAKDPYTDFTINANGTLYLLDNFRKYCPDAVFIFTSTNKVYGDTPNLLPLIEKETRFELPEGHKYYNGISNSRYS